MKKSILNLTLAATISLAMTACFGLGEDDETDGDPSAYSIGTMTAKVDGSTWESKPIFNVSTSYAAVTNEVLSITGTALSGTSASYINITVSGYTGPGTYTLGLSASDDHAFAQYIQANASKQTVHLAGYDTDGGDSLGSGEIIVTSEEEVDGKKVVTGTFKFTTGLSMEDNVEIENASIEVTNGAFKLTSQI